MYRRRVAGEFVIGQWTRGCYDDAETSRGRSP